MIRLFTGVTGGGKSYHAVEEIVTYRTRPVIANFALTRPRPNWDLLLPRSVTPGNLIRVALHGHTCYQGGAGGAGRRVCKCQGVRWRLGVEGACLLVLEEVTSLFQSREWDQDGRGDWIEFFNHHRKLGYDIILISQYDRAVDVQIRAVVDHEVEHHKAKHSLPQPFKLLAWLLPIPVFMRVERNYRMKGKLGGAVSFHILSRRLAKRYDSFALFNGLEELAALDRQGGAREAGGSSGRVVQLRRAPRRQLGPRVPDPAEAEVRL